MQKLIFLRIGLVLNLLEDAVGRLARARTAGLLIDIVVIVVSDIYRIFVTKNLLPCNIIILSML